MKRQTIIAIIIFTVAEFAQLNAQGCPPYTSCKYESNPHQLCQFCKKGTTCCFFNCTIEKTVCLGKDLENPKNIKVTPKNAQEVTESLYRDSQVGENLMVKDVLRIVNTLEKIVADKTTLNSAGRNFLGVVSNLVLMQKTVARKAQQLHNTSTRIDAIMGSYADKIDIIVGQDQVEVKENLAMFLQRVDINTYSGIKVRMQQPTNNKVFTTKRFQITTDINSTNLNSSTLTSIVVPGSILKDSPNSVPKRLSIIIYRNSTFFLPQDKVVVQVSHLVVSARFEGNKKFANLKDPVKINFAHEVNNMAKPVCVFWENAKRPCDWSGDGCRYTGKEDGLLTCQCSHLTNFAMLLDPNLSEKISGRHDAVLSTITYIGCGLSLLGVTLTAISFLFFKELRVRKPLQLLVNFCIALALLLITFIASGERSNLSLNWQCQTGAIFLHYFTLVVFFSMALIGFDFYLKFVKTVKDSTPHFLLKYLSVGWGVPAVIVSITVAASFDSYGEAHYCRLVGVPFFVTLLTPVAIVLFGNSMAFIRILYSIQTSGNNLTTSQTRSSNPLHQLRRAAAIFVILGLTWIFGLLSFGMGKLIFQYIFVVFNSIQGCLIFILYCLASAEMRQKYKKLFCRNKSGSTLTGHGGKKSASSTAETQALTTLPKKVQK